MKHVDIYSDGSARRNPGPGGFGALLRFTDSTGRVHERRISQGYELTTNNRMELLGVISAMELLREPCHVRVVTDSQYVCRAFSDGWIDNWRARGWRNAKKERVKNDDLWRRLLQAMEGHDVEFAWVKGHAGHAENELCDKLATEAADGPGRLHDVLFEQGGPQAHFDL